MTSDHQHWRYTVGTSVSPFYWPDEHSAVWHGFDHYRDPTPGDVVTVHRPDGSTYDLTRADWQPDRAAAMASLAAALDVDPALLDSQIPPTRYSDLLPDPDHVAAALDVLAATMTVDHLRPALADAGIPDPDRYVVAIEYDRPGQNR